MTYNRHNDAFKRKMQLHTADAFNNQFSKSVYKKFDRESIPFVILCKKIKVQLL